MYHAENLYLRPCMRDDTNLNLDNLLTVDFPNGLTAVVGMTLRENGEEKRCLLNVDFPEVSGVSGEQIVTDAMDCLYRLNPVLMGLNDAIGRCLGAVGDEELSELNLLNGRKPDAADAERGVLYLLSDKNFSPCGAEVVFRDDVMSHMAEVFGEDVFVLPSSTTEVLCVPVSSGFEAEDLKEIVKEVNGTKDCVDDSVYFSGHVFRYSQKKGLTVEA